MNADRVTDEMLMAYADGEIRGADAEALERAVARDSSLSEQLARFRHTRQLSHQSFAAVRARPVPPPLVRSVFDRPAEKRAARPGYSVIRLMPLAASIALAAGAGGYLAAGYRHAGSLLTADTAITAALESADSGGAREAGNDGRVQISGTYLLPERVCRSFSVQKSDGAVRGLGCRSQAQWHIELAIAERRSAEGAHALASDRATQSIDAFLDSAGAEGPLDAKVEADLRAKGWQQRR